MSRRKVITISRLYGSGGHVIGETLAKQLGIAFYDKELLAVASKDSGIRRELFENNDEKPTTSLLYSLAIGGHGMSEIGRIELPLTEKLFLAQFDAIRKVAKEGDCVVVGRCSDYVLRSDEDAVHVFIHAPLQDRIARIKELHELSTNEAKDLIKKVDRARVTYHNHYSDQRWADAQHYHLCVDSSVLGLEGTAEMIRQFIEKRA